MGYNNRRENVSWKILYEDSSLYEAHGNAIQSPQRIYTRYVALWKRGAGAPTSLTCRPMSGLESGFLWHSVQLVEIPLHSVFSYQILKLRQITPISWIIFAQLSKIDRSFYGIRSFITVFTRSCHWTLPWVSLIQATLSPPLSVGFVFGYIRPDIQMSSAPFKMFHFTCTCYTSRLGHHSLT
jgi:hypothetical protein